MKRYIACASASAERFGDLYDSGADNESTSAVYSMIESILDKYGTENDLVTDIFDRASREDQRKLMNLAERLESRGSGMSKDELLAEYRRLQRLSEKDALSAYQDGYLDALCDFADAFDIQL